MIPLTMSEPPAEAAARSGDLSRLLQIRFPAAFPADRPCSDMRVSVEHALRYADGLVCKVCRHQLIEVSTVQDARPQYIHGLPVPPDAFVSVPSSDALRSVQQAADRLDIAVGRLEVVAHQLGGKP